MNSLLAALLLVEFPEGSVAHLVQQEREADHHPTGVEPAFLEREEAERSGLATPEREV